MNEQADLSLCWSHRYYCRFCRAPAQIISMDSKGSDQAEYSQDIKPVAVHLKMQRLYNGLCLGTANAFISLNIHRINAVYRTNEYFRNRLAPAVIY